MGHALEDPGRPERDARSVEKFRENPWIVAARGYTVRGVTPLSFAPEDLMATAIVCARMSTEAAQALEQAAAERGITLSELIRELTAKAIPEGAKAA